MNRLEIDLARWEAGELPLWAVEARNPGQDVRGVAVLFERLHAFGEEPVPDPEESWAALLPRLSDPPPSLLQRARRRLARPALVAVAAALLTGAGAYAAGLEPVREVVHRVWRGVTGLLEGIHRAPAPLPGGDRSLLPPGGPTPSWLEDLRSGDQDEDRDGDGGDDSGSGEREESDRSGSDDSDDDHSGPGGSSGDDDSSSDDDEDDQSEDSSGPRSGSDDDSEGSGSGSDDDSGPGSDDDSGTGSDDSGSWSDDGGDSGSSDDSGSGSEDPDDELP